VNDRSPKKESKRVDFKEVLDLGKAEDWCEIIKDIVAMANSGGGSILLGVRNDGTTSGWNPITVLAVDPAQVVDKIAKYTGEQFSGETHSEGIHPQRAAEDESSCAICQPRQTLRRSLRLNGALRDQQGALGTAETQPVLVETRGCPTLALPDRCDKLPGRALKLLHC
jgi:hypothetical protein